MFYLFYAAVTTLGLLEVSETARSLSLRRQSERLLARIEIAPSSSPTLALTPVLARFYSPTSHAGFYVLWSRAGDLITSSDPDLVERLKRVVGMPPRVGQFDTEAQDLADQAVYFYTRYLPEASAFLTVGRHTVTDDIILDDVERSLIWKSLLLGVPLLVATLVISLATIRSMLRPVSKVSRLAAAISPADEEVRLPEAELPSEIVPLVRAANEALERLDVAHRLQRSFTADAAHQLRAPLAVISARVEAFEGHPSCGDLKRDVARMSRLVSQLLHLARLESYPLKREPLDLCHLAEEVVASMAPLAVRSGKEVGLLARCEKLEVVGDPDALGEALSNIVDNAIRHTAPGSTVEIEVETPGTVRVLDRGSGVSADARLGLFQRFNQGAASSGGSGLGLAIAQEIARRHGGEVTHRDREGGGAVFALQVA